MTPNNPQFKITARQVDMPEHERARRLAQAYDPLLAVYGRLIALAEGERETPETAVSRQGDVSHEG